MTHATMYPTADRSKWLPQFGNSTMPRISKLVLHSTESSALPSYPTFAPQLTFDPWRLKFWQHMPVNRSASTLADPSSTAVRENRDDVLQVEIIGYADPKGPKAFHVNAMPPKAIQMLGDLIAWLHAEWELPLVSVPPQDWLPYPRSYGRTSTRLSGAQYDAFAGVLGHQHVSGNDHGDPGDIPIAKIMTAAKVKVATTPAAPPVRPPKPAPKPPVGLPNVLTGAKPAKQIELARTFTLLRPSLLQGLQPYGGDGYLLAQAWQIPHGTIRTPRGVESSVFNRHDATGKYVDRMVCVAAGHCSTFATSGPYVWLSWDKVDDAGKVLKRRIARIPYRAGIIRDTDPRINWYDPHTGRPVSPALDLDHDRIGLRTVDSKNIETYELHQIDAFKRGINKPLAVVRTRRTATFQGWGLYGDRLWILRGKTDAPATLSEWTWGNDTRTGLLDLTHELKAIGATSFEPEGIWVSRKPHPVLHVGARFGSTIRRRFISYKIADL